MKQKIALVLSGGGARGLAHIGVIGELERRGYEISSIAGTSMGSLVGGVYALGKLEEFSRWVCSMDRMRAIRLVDFSMGHTGLVRGERMLRKMKDFIPDTLIEDLPIPYAAVAVDLRSNREVVFREGSIYDAIRPSISIPTVFTPVEMEGQLLVDGGVMNNVPVQHVARSPGDLLVAVNVNADIPLSIGRNEGERGEEQEQVYQDKVHDFYRRMRRRHRRAHQEKLGYFTLVSRTIDLMTNHMSELALEKHRPDIMINVSREHCHIFDFFKGEFMIEAGRQATCDILDTLERRNVNIKA